MSPRSGCIARRRALTLIELLIVLAIIGMLAAVLFPIFAAQRENARRTSCQSNLKKIGLALLQYCRDYDERLPRPAYERPHLVWQQVLQPYVESASFFICPSNEGWMPPLVSPAVGGNTPVPRSYGLNHRVSYGDRAVSLGSIASPPRKIMVAESRGAWPDYGSAWWKGDEWQQGFAGHLGTANYLFCDGHVKALRPSETASPFNMWGGMDGGACHSRSINCDTPEPAIIEGLEALQSRS